MKVVGLLSETEERNGKLSNKRKGRKEVSPNRDIEETNDAIDTDEEFVLKASSMPKFNSDFLRPVHSECFLIPLNSGLL